MYNARLGILPLRSYPAHIGSVISVVIGNELKDTGIEITETAEMIRMLREQNISPRTVTKGSDYQMIGMVCNLDYLLVGQAVVTTYSKTFVRTGVASVDFLETTAQMVDTTTGEVVLSAIVQRPPKKKWHQSDIIGQALAAAIKKELTKYSQP
jgi:curli biogenesis system outer membrane secretion channel CsgG